MSDNLNVLITGASQGIGASVARDFCQNPSFSKIILLSRPNLLFNNFCSKLRSEYNKKEIIQINCDLADEKQVITSMKLLYKNHKKVDVLINNAGYTNPQPLQQIDISDFRRTLEINLLAPFLIVQTLISMGNRFKTVLNIASTAGMKGRPGWISYGASKAAMINMTEAMKEELALFDTRVICISPGRCATSLRKTLAPDEDQSSIMQPQDVSKTIQMLISDVGKFVDSQNIVVRTINK